MLATSRLSRVRKIVWRLENILLGFFFSNDLDTKFFSEYVDIIAPACTKLFVCDLFNMKFIFNFINCSSYQL